MAILQQHQRDRMVESLKRQGITHPDVLNIMQTVPRHEFVDEALASHAYANYPLPIGRGQTISQPYVVARMTAALLGNDKPTKVLEIGTGCGYQTAILAHLFEHVYTIERIHYLIDKAKKRLDKLNLYNIYYQYGDGYQGWLEYAPYQAIIVTAAPENIPHKLLDQLEINGCLIIPVGQQSSGQQLLKIIRKRNEFEQHFLDAVSFVPLRTGTD
jgi:protein-L-isoaspartate(D-aspartate) O-methyltransferase